jgi:Flp pilus assembly pilin Flp
MMRWLTSLHRRFGRNESGASAVEFAILAPVLALALLGVADFGQMAIQRTDMHGALRSGGQYLLNGGRDLTVAREIVLRSWSSMPEDGIVETSRFCLCGETEHVCSAPCSDGSVPTAYITLRAHATLGGMFIDSGESTDDTIRVR